MGNVSNDADLAEYNYTFTESPKYADGISPLRFIKAKVPNSANVNGIYVNGSERMSSYIKDIQNPIADKDYTEISKTIDKEWIYSETDLPITLNNRGYAASRKDANEVGVENAMENNQILEKYIDKMDRDQSALREDVRESERRTSGHISSFEERMDLRLNRIENLISESKKDTDGKYDKIVESMNDLKTDTVNSTRWNIGISIATILGIAAMAISVWIAVLPQK